MRAPGHSDAHGEAVGVAGEGVLLAVETARENERPRAEVQLVGVSRKRPVRGVQHVKALRSAIIRGGIEEVKRL